MKRAMYIYLSFLIFSMAVCFLSAGTGTAQTQSATGLLAASGQPTYEIPEEKQQKWQSLQNMVQKQLDSCREDCGNDNACLKRCEDVSKVRLDREYKNLMSE